MLVRSLAIRRIAAAVAVSVAVAACGSQGSDGTAESSPAATASDATGSDDGASSTSTGGTAQEPTGSAPSGENCVDEVVLGAVWPQSGPFEFAGQASMIGAQVAVDEINAAGGIESLCGATVTIASADAGASAEDAASAVESLLSDHGDTSMILGSWLSSLTLAGTEISERDRVPWLSDSFADEVTERDGFTHVFAVAPPSSLIKELLLTSVDEGFAAANREMNTVALIGDNSAAAVALQEALSKEFADRGTNVAVTEQWAPGLDDASGIATKIAAANVDAVFLISYAFADVQLVVNALKSRDVAAPIIQNGGQGLLPAWRESGDSIVGMSTFVTANPVKGGEEISARLAKAAGEDYARQDHITGYLMVRIAAAAINQAGTTDREAINDAMRTTDFNSPDIVAAVATNDIQFGESGRITKPFGVMAQWQKVDGELIPCTIWPAEFAICTPDWGTTN